MKHIAKFKEQFKANKKKILVLFVMVALLVTTGVLNFVLNDSLSGKLQDANIGGDDTSIATFFSAHRESRVAARQQDLVILDSIIDSANASAMAKTAAEQQKLDLGNRMILENDIETLILAYGFEDVLVSIDTSNVYVVVLAESITPVERAQIASVVCAKTSYAVGDIKIIPYS